ncbi:ATP-dependent 6-phosphofructokinase 3-like [Lotus japonicus]|uniref:ATP-dependent 6-phosphofructokinase 3-like n=1 Tax=Lotus japonicus TaxID=34305 RepID=UPI00258790BA|nr:ATP-dependent 6-phosphofructokinase 3-like [Lotus japonicus]
MVEGAIKERVKGSMVEGEGGVAAVCFGLGKEKVESVKRHLFLNLGGYKGFYAHNTISLTSKGVNDIHKRGGNDTTKIVDSIQDQGINRVYIIGGDGTQRGACKIFEV